LKKIIWITSYPKSGNTYVRSFLSHYLYSVDGTINFDLLKKIPKFEKSAIFKKIIGNSINIDGFEYIKHSLKVQKKLIQSSKQMDLIFKTHNFFGSIDNYEFTNKENTLLFIYLIRDPREVLVSYASHSGLSIDQLMEFFLTKDRVQKHDLELIVNWGLHYKSWKSFKSVPSLFIKYEDLISNPKKYFGNIISFLSKHIDIKLDKELIKRNIDLNNFVNLREKEKEKGFVEASNNNMFFRSGKIDSWKNILNKDQIKAVENYFNNEMKELGYLK